MPPATTPTPDVAIIGGGAVGVCIELELGGADADASLPGMRAHLEGCPACHEDHESLRDFAALGTSGRT